MHDIMWYIAFITYEFLCAVPTPSPMWHLPNIIIHAQNDMHYLPIEVIKSTILLVPIIMTTHWCVVRTYMYAIGRLSH